MSYLFIVFCEHIVERQDDRIDLLLRDDERRDEAQHLAGRAVDDCALGEAVVDDVAAVLSGGELGAEDQARAADIRDECGVLGLEVLELLLEVAADLLDVREELRLRHRVQNDVGGGAGERVAAERRAVVTGVEGLGDRIRDDEGADGHAAREALCQRDDVRLDAVLLVGEELGY